MDLFDDQHIDNKKVYAVFSLRIFPFILFTFFGLIAEAQTVNLPAPTSVASLNEQYPVSLSDPQASHTTLLTSWGSEINPNSVHAEYPRPTLVRTDWQNLNGYWDWKDSSEQQESFTRRILVPFPVGSTLSGVFQQSERSLYRRTFEVPEHWSADSQIILHFGAVDWETTVLVNGQTVGTHRGGYDPFSFDITKFVQRNAANELVVQVYDPSQNGEQPRGRQSTAPAGVMYTASTGIWQTVWLEPVPPAHIKAVQILRADEKTGTVTLLPKIEGTSTLTVLAEILDGEEVVAKAYGGADGPLLLQFSKPKVEMWSPESPYLYQVRVQLLNKDTVVDKVFSYFAFRTIEIVKDKNGIPAVHLNGKRLFQMGIIDQGFWPDGLYTAPSDNAMRIDVSVAKSLGFNVIRKYQKIEPERWYFWCDRLGMLVWQDMPAGENRLPEAQTQFRSELQRMIQSRSQHPSIILWTIFNEGAGQHNTVEYADEVRRWDSKRLLNVTSGWSDSGLGDVKVSHKFPGPEMPTPDSKRAAIIGVFGGITLVPPAEHLWAQPEKIWGHQHVSDSDSLVKRYEQMHAELRRLIQTQGLAGAFFHQLTDIESEGNGLMPYDRRILKVPVESLEQINRETIRLGNVM